MLGILQCSHIPAYLQWPDIIYYITSHSQKLSGGQRSEVTHSAQDGDQTCLLADWCIGLYWNVWSVWCVVWPWCGQWIRIGLTQCLSVTVTESAGSQPGHLSLSVVSRLLFCQHSTMVLNIFRRKTRWVMSWLGSQRKPPPLQYWLMWADWLIDKIPPGSHYWQTRIPTGGRVLQTWVSSTTTKVGTPRCPPVSRQASPPPPWRNRGGNHTWIRWVEDF